jgi:hypothetical protein
MKTIIGFYYRQANEVRQGIDADEKHRAFLHIPGNKPILTWFRRRSSGRDRHVGKRYLWGKSVICRRDKGPFASVERPGIPPNRNSGPQGEIA